MNTPRRPPAWKWQRMVVPGRDLGTTEAWQRGKVRVLSSHHELIEFRGALRDQWHISISVEDRTGQRARRATDDEVAQVLRDFGLDHAEEDNHHPGVARHFFQLVSPNQDEIGVQCDCKEDEIQHVEADGYRWSETNDGGKLPKEAAPPIGGWSAGELSRRTR